MHSPLKQVATVAGVAAAVAVSAAGLATSLWIATVDHQSLLGPALSATVAAAFAVIGAVVASARPANRVGWTMLGGALLWAVGSAGVDAAQHGIVTDPGTVFGSAAAAAAAAVGGSALRGLGWLAVTLGVAMFFPDGRVAGPRWRWLPRALLASAVASVLGVLTASDANITDLDHWRNPIAVPTGLQPISGLLSLGGLLVGVGATIGAAVQLWRRWSRGGPLERQQLMLFALAAILPVIAGPIVVITDVGGWLFSAAALPLPFAIGIAVLAHGLYDLKTAANRTLVWALLSAVVAACYALVLVGVGDRFDVRGATWLPWLAATVVAISFAPLRDGLQRGVNRITFGRWDEPYDVLAGLGQRLEATADVDRLLAEVVLELRGLGLADVTICDNRGDPVAGAPGGPEEPPSAGAAGAGAAVQITLAAYGRPVGTLNYRAPVTPLRARDLRVLGDLARHLGGVLHAHHLTLDLQRALEGSVLAREEERRRLRRDLHDGLGPALAGHLLRLDLIASTIGPGSPATGQVDLLRDELRGTVLEVRRVVEGLRPPALDELGLAGALTQLSARLTARSPVAVELCVSELTTLPAAMEVAAYRIVSEALTNTVRHANATSCLIAIHEAAGTLRITIRDDGAGLDRQRSAGSGNGLHTMRERAEELRGQLRVLNGNGTTIVAELPLPASARAAPIETSAAR